MARLYSMVARIASISPSVICALARCKVRCSALAGVGWCRGLCGVFKLLYYVPYHIPRPAQNPPRVPGVSTWTYDTSRKASRGIH